MSVPRWTTPDGYVVEIIILDDRATYSVKRNGLAVGGGPQFKQRGLMRDPAQVRAVLGESFADLHPEEATS